MWYIVAAAAFLWLYLDRSMNPVITDWLHQPVAGSHAANVHGIWLAGIMLVVLIIAALLTHKTGEAVPGVPRDNSWVMALAFAFVGFLWYLVQVNRKPAVTIVRPQPTVTVTPGHPVTSVVHTVGINWELVATFGIVGVIVLAVLYFIVRYVL
jgi:hypothetical protein